MLGHMATVDHKERRRLIVANAMRLFASMGFAKVSFLDISKSTGLARTALYRYFKTKREIFDEAIHAITSGIRFELGRIAAMDASAAKRMEASCSTVIDAMYGKKEFFSAIYEFVFSMARSGHDMAARIEQFTGGFKVALRNLVKEGVSTGEFRRNVDPEAATEALYALMESVALRVMLGVEKDPTRAKRRFGAVISDFVA